MTLDQLYKLATECTTPIRGLLYSQPTGYAGTSWYLHVATCADFDRLRSLPVDRERRWLNGDRRHGGTLTRHHFTDGGYIVHVCPGCPADTSSAETAA